MKDDLIKDRQVPEWQDNGGIDLANLSRLQAAKLCGVSPTTFDMWWREYGLPYYQLPGLGNQKRFKIKEIQEWQGKFYKAREQKVVFSGIRKVR